MKITHLFTGYHSCNFPTPPCCSCCPGHGTTAADGQQVLDLWHANHFHCILMDIQMPIMDGVLTEATIRSEENKMGGHMPIIALTAHAFQGDRKRFIAEGLTGMYQNR